MKCNDVRELVSAWLDDEIDKAGRSAVETHIESCDDCRIFFEEMASQEKTLQGLAAVPAPEVDTERAVRRWREAATAPPRRMGRLSYFSRYVAVPAVAAAAAAAFVIALRPSPAPVDYRYRPLSEAQHQFLETPVPVAAALKYRVGVILTDLNNMPASTSSSANLDVLRDKIVAEDFLGSIATAKAEALRGGDKEAFRLYTQLEMILLGIVNGDTASLEMARTVRL